MRRLAGSLLLLLAATPAIAGPLDAPGWTRSDVRRYYPSSNYRSSGPKPIQGWFEIRGGVYDAQSTTKDDWTVGIKTSGQITPIVQLGLPADLHRRENAGRTVTSSYVDPAGNVVTTSTTAVQNESNLWPVMATLEFRLPTGVLEPYVGGGAGWEFLNVQAYDATTGLNYSANYNGFGYQGFGGLRIPLGSRARVSGEVYYNGATVDRHFFDPVSGFEIQESVDVNGVGARGGLSFAF